MVWIFIELSFKPSENMVVLVIVRQSYLDVIRVVYSENIASIKDIYTESETFSCKIYQNATS